MAVVACRRRFSANSRGGPYALEAVLILALANPIFIFIAHPLDRTAQWESPLRLASPGFMPFGTKAASAHEGSRPPRPDPFFLTARAAQLIANHISRAASLNHSMPTDHTLGSLHNAHDRRMAQGRVAAV